MQIIPLPAFSDNYLWLIRDGRDAVVVDPGDARPVRDYLVREGLSLRAIMVTHHHADHVGGVAELAQAGVPVFGPGTEGIAEITQAVREGEVLRLPGLGLAFEVIEVPGHTRGHIAYYGHGTVFCGDTLFSAGCGRVFEGTPAQLHASLCKLMALPDETTVHCAHEYTLANLKFARVAEPDNPLRDAYAQECERLRAANRPTLPSTIAREKAINPFLRCASPTVRASLPGAPAASDVEVFTALREWKNRF